jgi:3-deoxy-7-phosphoheptulonate synthase
MAFAPFSDLGWRTISRARDPELAGTKRTRPIRVGAVEIGGARPIVIAGPCAVETPEQTLEIARACAEAGADLLRGGAYKPRTSSYSFQGLGEAGLEILVEARRVTGLPIVTEALDVRLVGAVERVADVIQIGSRNMQNVPLLVEAGRVGKPVLVKRGMCATLEEWLCAAEYVARGGTNDILLCERGVRGLGNGEYDRMTLDLNVVPAVLERTWLPVIVDPSHGTGVAAMVPRASLAAIAYGAQGLLIEVMREGSGPDDALCDGDQGIWPSALRRLVDAIPGVAATLEVEPETVR